MINRALPQRNICTKHNQDNPLHICTKHKKEMLEPVLNLRHAATSLPVLGCSLLVGLLLFHFFSRGGRGQAIKAPLVDGINGRKFRVQTLASAAKLWQHGYHKYPKTPFLVPSSVGTTLIVPPSDLDYLKGLPDSTLSFERAFSDQMMAQYTRVVPKNAFPLTASAIKSDLTPHIPKLNSRINELVEQAISHELPAADEWTTYALNEGLLRIVSIVTGEIFIGPEHGKDERYLDIASNYTVEVISSSIALQLIPSLLRSLVAPFTPQIRALRRRERSATRFFAPIIQARKQAAARGDLLPDDMMTWMLKHGAKLEVQDLARQVHLQLGLTFAAVHTTTMTATNV
jgi:hypothetical protein